MSHFDSKYAILSQYPFHLHDKHMCSAKCCHPDIRTFYASFSGLKNRLCQLFCFLDIWLQYCIFRRRRSFTKQTLLLWQTGIKEGVGFKAEKHKQMQIKCIWGNRQESKRSKLRKKRLNGFETRKKQTNRQTAKQMQIKCIWGNR